MLVFFLHALIVGINCQQPLQWSQAKADPFHSSSLKVDDNQKPPQPQTLNYSNPNGFPCSPRVNELILTSSGHLIGNAYCPGPSGNNVYNMLFRESFQSSGSWTKKIRTDLLSNLVMGANGKTAIAQTWGGSVESGFSPLIINVVTGESTKVDAPPTFRQSESIVGCPKTDSGFLLQGNNSIQQIDPRNNTLLPTGAHFVRSDLDTYLVSDLSSRVARVVHPDSVDREAQRLIVWETQKTGNIIKLSQRWWWNIPRQYYMKTTSPAFSRFGRVYLAVHLESRQNSDGLFIFDSNTGKSIPGISFFTSFKSLKSLSITSDGEYAVIWYSEGVVVVQTTGQDAGVVYQSWGGFERTDLTAVDEENSVFYSVKDCQLTSYCLKKDSRFTQTVCGWPGKASKLILGKYSGGERRIFVGLEVSNSTQIRILDGAVSPSLCS